MGRIRWIGVLALILALWWWLLSSTKLFSYESIAVSNVASSSTPRSWLDDGAGAVFDPEFVFWDRSVSSVEKMASRCKEAVHQAKKSQLSESSYEFQMLQADCGEFADLAVDRHFRIYFYGKSWKRPKFLHLSGCPEKCPTAPHCTLHFNSNMNDYTKADMVVFFSYDWNDVRALPGVEYKHRVVYWREGDWTRT